MRFIKIQDEHSYIFRWKVQNESIACQVALVQLIVTVISLAQHVYSILVFKDVFHCRFNDTVNQMTRNSDQTNFRIFLSYDVIIFDFGLFYRLIPNLDQCLANYMDGGYGRFMWCISQTLAVLTLLIIPFISKPQRFHMWPVMIMENTYCLGLLILTIATADKLTTNLLTNPGHLTYLIVVFLTGTGMNYFLTYVLWHLYWHVEAEESRRKRQVSPAPSWI